MTTGTDIIEISRIEKAIRTPRFLQRVYTEGEIQYLQKKSNSAQTAAGIYCAKEAVLKALGTGLSMGISLREIEITHDGLGKPEILLAGKALQIFKEKNYANIQISISHCDSYAVAFCVMV